VDIQDVTPTLLDLLGLPVAEDLDGRVIPGVLSAEIDRGRVLHRIATYGAPTPVETPEHDDPASFEEKLRALGYLRD
jgi:arylsulfatase A-like enzyme